jgi:hypothetical protein
MQHPLVLGRTSATVVIAVVASTNINTFITISRKGTTLISSRTSSATRASLRMARSTRDLWATESE